MSVNRAWTTWEENELERLWSEDLSTREIGAYLKRKKNSIIGKALRMRAEGRPLPKRRTVSPRRF